MDKKKSSRAHRNPVPTVDVIIEIKDDFPLAFDHDRILDDYYAAGAQDGTAPGNRRKRRIQHDRP